MAYHKSWNNEDLRRWMVEAKFTDYEDCGHFASVVYNGAWTTFTFLKRKDDAPKAAARPEFLVVSSRTEFICGARYSMEPSHYEAVPKMMKPVSKEDGNRLYRAILKTKRTSRRGGIFYDLGRALDSLPADSTLAQSFIAG